MAESRIPTGQGLGRDRLTSLDKELRGTYLGEIEKLDERSITNSQTKPCPEGEGTTRSERAEEEVELIVLVTDAPTRVITATTSDRGCQRLFWREVFR
jgi:hypothetical protein